MRMSDRDKYEKIYLHIVESIRIHVWEIYNGNFHLMRQIMEYYRARKRDLHIVFTDLEKTYDKIPIIVLLRAMTKKGISKNTLILYKICIEK